MSVSKAFNNHFIEFLEDVICVLPGNKNVKTAKFYVTNLNRINPTLVIKAWHLYCVVPYSEQIDNGDFSFFINKDYKSDVGKSPEYNSGQVLDAIEEIRVAASGLSDENQQKIVKYVQNLSKLAIMYKKK
jgi:hypothetical protein